VLLIVDMGQAFFVVDSFTDRPFAGNPAAVCVLDQAADEAWMRNVAREMNLSETAFLHPERDQPSQSSELPALARGGLAPPSQSAGGSEPSQGSELVVHHTWRLRWLTPSVEVDLCGHGTLAAAHVLWQSGGAVLDRPLRFLTRSGVLQARTQGGLILLDFPARPVEEAAPAGLTAALGLGDAGSILFVGSNKMDYLVELASAADVRACRPDMAALAKIPVRGVMVTARGEVAGIDFISRFFGPGSGIPEDPVTGSAHCALAPYWGAKLGKTAMVGFQASARGGTVAVEVRGDRVQLGGQAVTVSKGELLFGPRR
jgi:PhzF family phenazine biosynthesis protein